jgi:methylenetetrahydrofolate dehydrogenase (NADP+)/methenyltetrahydrofolate cyclohydrolase
MATVIDGKATAESVRQRVAGEVAEFRSQTGHTPGLVTILVGEDAASQVYVASKGERCREVGMSSFHESLPATAGQAQVEDAVARWNADDRVDGILVQLPLPDHIDENRVIEAIASEKDVDGIHPVNAGRLYLGRPTLVPGTPLGIMRMLDEYEIPLEGARAVVVGRSAIVGKPVAHLLLQRNATVTICHSRTQDLERHTLDADVLVAAVGRTHLISADMVKAGATVIDVGMNRDESSRKVLGDVDPGAMERAAYMTPVPGGVGPMTIAMVLQNAVTAARLRRPAAIATRKN